MIAPAQGAVRSPSNLDPETVSGFGEEWSRYDQSGLDEAELSEVFGRYFAVFPWHELPRDARGFDLGCGSGRWARFVAPRVGHLACIDASEQALAVARRNLAAHANCSFHHASVDGIPLADGSQDFGYSLGVLHHVPDTRAGLRSCVASRSPSIGATASTPCAPTRWTASARAASSGSRARRSGA